MRRNDWIDQPLRCSPASQIRASRGERRLVLLGHELAWISAIAAADGLGASASEVQHERPSCQVGTPSCRTLCTLFFYSYAVCRQFEASASRAWRLRLRAGSARRHAVSREARGRIRAFAFAVLTRGSDLHGHLLVALPPPRRGSTMHSGSAIALRDVPAAASHGTACWACQGSGCFGRA